MADPAEVSALRHQVSDLQQQLTALRLSGAVNGVAEVPSGSQTPAASGSQPATEPVELTETVKRAAAAELESAGLRQRVAELEAQLSAAPSAIELSQLRQKVTELESCAGDSASASASAPAAAAAAAAGVSDASAAAPSSAAELAEVAELRQRVSRQEAELGQLRGAAEELEELRREQEDLLVLLTDQEARQEEYKKKLRQLGVQVGAVVISAI